MYIGTNQDQTQYALMELEYLHILLASKDILLQLGYVIGKLYIANSTNGFPSGFEWDRVNEGCQFVVILISLYYFISSFWPAPVIFHFNLKILS